MGLDLTDLTAIKCLIQDKREANCSLTLLNLLHRLLRYFLWFVEVNFT